MFGLKIIREDGEDKDVIIAEKDRKIDDLDRQLKLIRERNVEKENEEMATELRNAKRWYNYSCQIVAEQRKKIGELYHYIDEMQGVVVEMPK